MASSGISPAARADHEIAVPLHHVGRLGQIAQLERRRLALEDERHARQRGADRDRARPAREVLTTAATCATECGDGKGEAESRCSEGPRPSAGPHGGAG